MSIIEANSNIRPVRYVCLNLEQIKKEVENNINYLQEKDCFGYNLIYYASNYAEIDVLKYLCEKYMQNPQLNINRQCISGNTALHFSSRDGELEKVKILCEAGIDMNIVNNFGKTALHFASQNWRLEIVKFLCEAGADIDIMDKKGKTALDLAKTEEIRNYLEGQSNGYVLK